MPADTLERPMVNVDMSGYDPNAAQSLFGKPEAPQAPPAKTEAPKEDTTTNKDGQQLTDKPVDTKETTKSRLDKMGAVKKPEPKKEEQKPNGQEPTKQDEGIEEGKLKDPKHLRDAYNLTKKERDDLKAELDKVKPDYEKIRKDFDLTREELSKLKAMNLNDDERKRFDSLRQIQAVEEFKESPEHKTLMEPINERIQAIQAVARVAKLNPLEYEALSSACDIPVEFERNRQIRRVLQGAVKSEERPDGIEADDITDAVSTVTAAARELMGKYYPDLAKAEKNALDIQLAARTNQKQQAEATKHKETEEMKREHEFVRNALSDNTLKALLEDTDLSVEGVTLSEALKDAAPADNPRDRAVEIQSAAALPFVIAFANKWRLKAHEYEEAEKARNGANPSSKDAVVKTHDTRESLPDANSFFKNPANFRQG